ncbi:MAG TPA: polyprenol monophosphomannose synthase [Phycisphaerae bacterium]|nr:polyprenol monophosphomannose synthase [Phycisphaerae bacterium]
MPQPPVSIVVPTYREAQNIPILTRRVFETLRAADIPAELIFVDDHSRDGTETLVTELAAHFPVRLITRFDERGLSSAVVRGFSEAKYDILLCMDADLSHPPEVLPAVIAPIADGRADFCIGSRYTAGGKTKEDWGFLRQLNSQVATLLARPLTAAKDPMAGFFCLTRDTLDRAQAAGLNPIGYKIGLEILIKARCQRVTEVPIEFSDRLHGKSKLTLKQQIEYLQHLGRLYRFRWPYALPLVLFVVLVAALAPILWVYLY